MTDDDAKVEIDWMKTLAGALAAVSAAVLLSTLGAAGTLVGAAVGSIAVTVGSQLYAQGLARSKRTMAKAQETALNKVGIAQAEVRRAGRRQGDDAAVGAHLDHADEQLGEAKADLDEVREEPAVQTWGQRLALLPWRRIALLAAATFAVVLIAIAAFEQVSGRSVSSYTGGSDQDSGSTFPGMGNDSERDDGPPSRPDPAPSDGPGPSDEPTTEAPSDEPSEEPSEPVAPSPNVPTPTAPPSTTPLAP